MGVYLTGDENEIADVEKAIAKQTARKPIMWYVLKNGEFTEVES